MTVDSLRARSRARHCRIGAFIAAGLVVISLGAWFLIGAAIFLGLLLIVSGLAQLHPN